MTQANRPDQATARRHQRASQDERPAWHAMDRAAVEERLWTDKHGLSTDEARARLDRYGPNEIEEVPPPSNLLIFLRQFESPLIYILFIAGIITILLDEYVDAAAIVAVLLINALIGFFQERQAEFSVRALMQLLAPRARVLRDGREWEVDSRELVPGDLVLLESGARVPADLRLVAVSALEVDESLLTGESTPVDKQTEPLPPETPLADRTNIAFSGTVVSRGRGRGYVVATGEATEIGQIAREVRAEPRAETPLQQRVARFARIVGLVVAITSVIVFLVGVAEGVSPTEMFRLAVALAVASVPEGLPAVFTITLAIGVQRMARRNAILRRLTAAETLGSTTVIGSDKTGTLTENRMTVQSVWAGGRTFSLTDAHAARGFGLAGVSEETIAAMAEHRPFYMTILTGVLTNEASLYRTERGVEGHGDPTEVALLVAAARLGLEPDEVRDASHVYAEVPFESERRYSASIRQRDGKHVLFVKGAPERVVAMCSRLLTDEGEVELDRAAVMEAARQMADQGLRVLAMAYRELPRPLREDEDVPEPTGLTLAGFQGMTDPPRPGVREAIRGCQEAGIRVIMITGDHVATARVIGAELGISPPDAPALTGRDLDALDDVELRRRVHEVSIYARVAPRHKLRVLHALQSLGEVVAITGDGVNDAPALKAADIGVAMGRGGTDVAREAADMVLVDDNFVSIYAAVEEGRVTFDNLRKVTFFLISTGAAEVLTIVGALFLRWPLVLLPTQILWLNLVTESLPNLSLAFEPGERGVLRRPPRPRQEGIVTGLLWERTLMAGLVQAAGTLYLFWWALAEGGSIDRARTIALTTMVLFQMFQAGNARSEWESIFQKNPFTNPLLLATVAAALAIHVGSLHFWPTQFVLRVVPLEPAVWLRMAAVAATLVLAMELHKLARRPPERSVYRPG